MAKKIAILVSVVLIAGLLFGCGSGGGSTSGGSTSGGSTSGGSTAGGSAATHGKTFNLIIHGQQNGVDPHNTVGTIDEYVGRCIFDVIADTDHYGNRFGVLCDTWEYNEDCTEMTFTLRKGITFTNGEPWNADVFVYNINRLVEYKDELGLALRYYMPMVGAVKVDDYTVKMLFDSSFPFAHAYLRLFMIIPMQAHMEYGEDFFNQRMLYGTGPWKFGEWVNGQYTYLTKNEDYWDKEHYDSYFDDGYLRYILEPTSAAAAHIAGDADAYVGQGGINRDILPLYAGSEDKIELVEIELLMHGFVTLSFKEGSVFNDIRVREAASLAIDRQSIADNIYMSGRACVGVLQPGVTGYDPSMPPYEYNPEKAKQLLAESGYDGRELVFTAANDGYRAEDATLAIASMLTDVGFNIKVLMEDTASMNERSATGNFDMNSATFLSVDGIPFGYFQWNYLSDTGHHFYKDDTLTEYLLQFTQGLDPDKREIAARNVGWFVKENFAPYLPFALVNAVHAVSYGLDGLYLYPDGQLDFHHVDWDPSLTKWEPFKAG